MIWSGLSRWSHKNNISVTLISRLMLSSIDSKTRGFSTYSFNFFSKMKLRTEIWRKTYISPLCYFAILPWLPMMPFERDLIYLSRNSSRNFSQKWLDKLHETLRRVTQRTTVTIHAITLALAAAAAAASRTKIWPSATVKANYFVRGLSVVRFAARNNVSHNALVRLPSRISRDQLHNW